MKRLFWSLFLSVGLLVPYAGFAQTAKDSGVEEKGMEYLLFEEIPTVQSSNFFALKQTKVPGTSVVISGNEIANSPARTLADLIEEYVPSMYVSRGEEYGSIVSARGYAGSGSDSTLVLRDGQNMNHITGFGWATEFDLPLLGDIQNIEVITGPGAIVHGSGAFNGFINLKPKTGTDNPGFFLSNEYGFVENLDAIESGYGAKFGNGIDNYLYGGVVWAHGTKFEKDVWKSPLPAYVGSDPSNPTDASRRDSWLSGENNLTQGFPQASFKVTDDFNFNDFNLNTYIDEINTQANGVYPYYDNAHNPIRTVLMAFRPKYSWKQTDVDTLDLSFNAKLAQFELVNSANGINGNKAASSERDFDLEVVEKTTRFKNHSLALGVDIGQDWFHAQDLFLGDNSLNGNEQGLTGSWKTFSVFGEDIWQIIDPLTASAGLRWDEIYYSPFKNSRGAATGPNVIGGVIQWGTSVPVAGTPWSDSFRPAAQHNLSQRYALAYEITPDTNAKLSFQQGFRVPDAGNYDKWSFFSKEAQLAGYAAFPDLKPEQMNSTEFNLSQKIDALKVKLDGSVYFNRYSNILNWFQHGWMTDPETSALQEYPRWNWWDGTEVNSVGTFNSLGFELGSTWQPIDSTTVKLSYAYTMPYRYSQTVYDQGGEITTTTRTQWMLYPGSQIKNTISTDFLNKKMNLTVFNLLTSGFDVSKSGGYLSPVYDRNRFYTDVALTYHITKNLSVKATIKNLFGCHVPQMTYYGNPYAGAAGQEKRYYYLTTRLDF